MAARKLQTKLKPVKTAKVQSRGLLGSPTSPTNIREYIYQMPLTGVADKDITDWDRRESVDNSEKLFAQVPMLNAALKQIVEWSIGDAWDFVYTGTANTPKGWAEQVEQWVNYVWYPQANVRGFAFDFKTTLKLIIQERIRSGDILILPIPYGVSGKGMPQLQLVRSLRVNSGRNFVVKEGVQGGENFIGLPLVDGVVNGPFLEQKAFYIPGDKPEEDRIVSVGEGARLVYRPDISDLGRGLPEIYSGILTGKSIQEIHTDIESMIKLMTLLALNKKTETGEPTIGTTTPLDDDYDDTDAEAPNNDKPQRKTIGIERMPKGGLGYMRTDEELKALATNFPNIEAQDYLNGRCIDLCAALGWPHSLMFAPDSVTTGPQMGEVEIAKKTIETNQHIVRKYATGFVIWAISNAISRGILPPNNKEPWWNLFTFTQPAELTINRNDQKIDLEAIRGGIRSRNSVTIKNGQDYEQVLTEVDKENRMLAEKVQKFSTDYNLSFNAALNFYEMRSPNPLPEPAAEPVSPTQPKKPQP